MKQYIIRSILNIIIIMGILFFFCYVIYDLYNTTYIQKGQIWVKEYVKETPYNKGVYDTIEVINVLENVSLIKHENDTLVWENDDINTNRKLIN